MKDDMRDAPQRLRNNSISGESARRNKTLSEQQIRRKEARRLENEKEEKRGQRLKYLLVAVTTAASIILGTTGVSAINNEMVVNGMIDDFQEEVVSDNTFRTNNHQNFWYDYQNIAISLNDYAKENGLSKCQTMYLCEHALAWNKDVEEDQMNKLLKFTDYKNLDNFLQENGFKNKADFENQMKAELPIVDHINEEQTKLDEMQNNRENSLEQESGKSRGGM